MTGTVYYLRNVRHGAGCKVADCVLCAYGRFGEAATAAGDAFDRLLFVLPRTALRTRGRRSAARGTTRTRFQGLREKVARFPGAKGKP